MPDSVKLLYVDDDDDISSIVELAFEGDDRFHLTVCHSGQEALIAAEQAPPDMVLPATIAADGQATLDALFTACAADPALGLTDGRFIFESMIGALSLAR